MKKIILIICVGILSISAYSQESAIDKYFQKYAESEEFTKVNISAKMFEMFAYIDPENEDDKEVLNTIKNLKGMKMLVQDSISNGKAEYQHALKMPSSDYEVLMTIEDESEDITFFIKENQGVVNELLLIGGGTDNFFVLSLYGIIDLKQISKFAKKVNIGGLEHLEHVDDK